jgi:ubiquitin carboxyl-terminal hydrolase 25/28
LVHQLVFTDMVVQYFYTIKDLREAVQPMSKLDLTTLDDDKLSDEDLKRHRVGGRLVTRREIMRSKKCMLYSSLIVVFELF